MNKITNLFISLLIASPLWAANGQFGDIENGFTFGPNQTLYWDGAAFSAKTLGTAASLDVGTGANQILQLDSSGKIPAVNGSQLTGITTDIGVLIHACSPKASISDNDEFGISDSDASYAKKKTLWSTIKSVLKTYFDTLYTLTNLGGVPISRTVNSHALSSDVTVTKGDVGLGNCDNTADINKTVAVAANATTSNYASIAGTATTANVATTATSANSATIAASCTGNSATATVANSATTANSASIATTATSANSAASLSAQYIDWNQSSGGSSIANKPTIPTALSALSDDTTHRLVTDTEKGTWNGKQDALGFTAENVSNKSTVNTLGTSDTAYPSQYAVKQYVDTGLSGKENSLGFSLSGTSGATYTLPAASATLLATNGSAANLTGFPTLNQSTTGSSATCTGNAGTVTVSNGQILIGNGSNVGASYAPSGDVTMSGTGVFTIGSNKVSNSKAAQMAAYTVKANATGTTANSSDITIESARTLLGVENYISGKQFLFNWFSQLGKIFNNGYSYDTGVPHQVNIAFIGDSWVEGVGGLFTLVVADELQQRYSLGGSTNNLWRTAGYYGFTAEQISYGAATGTLYGSVSRGGSWGDSGYSIDFLQFPDCYAAGTIDPAATVTLTANEECDGFKIYWLNYSSDGVFKYNVDGGGWTNVSTNGTTGTVGVTTISGLSWGYHTLNIAIQTIGTSGQVFFGAQPTLDGAQGWVKVHKFGHSGLATADYVAADAPTWESSLALFNPHVIGILLGTVDMNNNVAPSTYYSNLTTIVQRCKAVQVNVSDSGTQLTSPDVIVIAPADNGLVGKTYTMSQYRDKARQVAIENNCGFIDLYAALGDYATANKRELYSDSSHPSSFGYAQIANIVVDCLSTGAIEKFNYFNRWGEEGQIAIIGSDFAGHWITPTGAVTFTSSGATSLTADAVGVPKYASIVAGSTTSTNLFTIASVAVSTTSSYDFECTLQGTSTSNAGVQVGINAPAGATVEAQCIASGASGTTIAYNRISALNTATGAVLTGTGVGGFISIKGTLTTAGTAGNLDFQGKKVTGGTFGWFGGKVKATKISSP